MKIDTHGYDLEIHPIAPDDLQAVLHVYQQCEDFLALGPVSTASLERVRKDIEISASEGGITSKKNRPTAPGPGGLQQGVQVERS